jgi:hypothetical protein
MLASSSLIFKHELITFSLTNEAYLNLLILICLKATLRSSYLIWFYKTSIFLGSLVKTLSVSLIYSLNLMILS